MTLFHRLSKRGLIAYGHDIVMAGLSYVLAWYLRVGATDYNITIGPLVEGAVLMTVIAAVVFFMSGLYRGVWRYASMHDLMAIIRAVTLTIVAFVIVMFVWSRMGSVPRSLPFINWFVLMALLGGPRFLYRFWKDRRIDLSLIDGGARVPVLLIGASDGADQFLRGLNQRRDHVYDVVGILSERTDRVGRTIRGIDVLGTVPNLEQVFLSLKSKGTTPRRLILTKDEIRGAPVRDLLDRATALGMTLARVPRLTDFQAADGERIEIKPVAIEDLLGRPQTPLERDTMRRLIQGRRVLVTGAGGSIGSELARQIAGLAPVSLALVDSSEYALYSIDREIAEGHTALPRSALIADVRDHERIAAVLAAEKPAIVFHAAALKHVPLVEDNVAEGVRTNVFGTVSVADACRSAGVDTLVVISTDKAVNPTSVMGATKRCAEMYAQALDVESGEAPPHVVTVRFGNVLGSTGSVVPLFQRQLAAGGPLTVTHPEMTRYFMTIREAVELVLEAAAVGAQSKGAGGRIYVLDMGEPVRILDLARQMIRIAGMEPDKDVAIEFTGIRPGEKLYEEVFHGAEAGLPTEHAGLLLAAPRIVAMRDLARQLVPLKEAAMKGDDAACRRILHDIVPEFVEPTDAQPTRIARRH